MQEAIRGGSRGNIQGAVEARSGTLQTHARMDRPYSAGSAKYHQSTPTTHHSKRSTRPGLRLLKKEQKRTWTHASKLAGRTIFWPSPLGPMSAPAWRRVAVLAQPRLAAAKPAPHCSEKNAPPTPGARRGRCFRLRTRTGWSGPVRCILPVDCWESARSGHRCRQKTPARHMCQEYCPQHTHRQTPPAFYPATGHLVSRTYSLPRLLLLSTESLANPKRYYSV